MKTTVALILLALGVTNFSPVHADDRKAALLIRQGQVKEAVLGDVQSAIKLYEQAAVAAGNRAVAAEALLAMANAKQRIGAPDARAAFERVVREFGDQQEFASKARTRLAALGSVRAQAPDATPRKIGVLDTFGGETTEDGRFWIGKVGTYDIVLRDLTSGERATLVSGTAERGGWAPAFSRDGREFAYVWVEGALNDPRATRSLRVAATSSGSAPRTVAVVDQSVREYFPVGWSGDGKAILVRYATLNPSATKEVTYSFAWISLADGSLRTVKTLEPNRRVFSVRLSPDGRYVAYMATVRETERHIFTLDTRTGVESEVVKFAGANNSPAWSSDASLLVFVSDHSGTPGFWAVRLRDGVAVGEPTHLNVPGGTVGARPLRVTQDGTLQYVLSIGGGLVTFVLERNSLNPRLLHTIVGANATWSPDGKWMALIRQRGQEHDLVVRSVPSGEERLHRRQGLANVPPRWTQNSATVLVVTEEGPQAQRYFYAVETSTGEFKRLFAVDPADSIRTAAGALSRDGRTLYLAARERTDDAPWTRIVAIDTATGAEKSTIDLPSGGLPGGFDRRVPGIAISPDGSTLAIEGWIDASMKRARIVTVGVNGGGYKEVYGPFPVDNTPDRMRWAPDGQSLLFTSIENERVWRIMRVAVGGGTPVTEIDSTRPPALAPIPELYGGLWNLDISPDGTGVLVGGNAQERHEVWAIDNVLSLLSLR